MSFSVRISGQVIGPLAYHEILKRAVGWQKLGVSIEVAPTGTQTYQPLAAFLAAGSITCPACGSPNLQGAGQCGSCGMAFASQGSMKQNIASTSNMWLPSVPTMLRGRVKTIAGLVVHTEAPYTAKPDWNWRSFSIKAALLAVALVVLGPVVLGITLAVWMFALLWTLFLPRTRQRGTGFKSAIAAHVFGYFLADRLLRKDAEVPVRDIRVQDSLGQQWLVRMKGELVCGSVRLGDEIVAECDDRQGTMILRSGWNKTLNAAIAVKP